MPAMFYVCVILSGFSLSMLAYLLFLHDRVRYKIIDFKSSLVFPVKGKTFYFVPSSGQRFGLHLVGTLNILSRPELLIPIDNKQVRISIFKLKFPLNSESFIILKMIDMEYLREIDGIGSDPVDSRLADIFYADTEKRQSHYACSECGLSAAKCKCEEKNFIIDNQINNVLQNWKSPGRRIFERRWQLAARRKYLSDQYYSCGNCKKNFMECSCKGKEIVIICDICANEKSQCICDERSYLVEIKDNAELKQVA